MSRHWEKCPVAVFNIKVVYSAVIMPVINLVKPKFGEAFWKLNWIRGRGPQALALAPYPWGPLYWKKQNTGR